MTPNVLLIVWDTVRDDHVSSDGSHRTTTPFLDTIAGDLVRFAHASAPAPWTVPSIASMFTGLYPAEHGAVRTTAVLPSHVPVLAEVLRDLGYQTAGFSQNPLVDVAGGFGRGFGTFLSHKELCGPYARSDRLLPRAVAKAVRHFTVPGRRTLAAVQRWLRERPWPDSPFFVFINFMDAHWPLRPPRAWRRDCALTHTPDGEALLSYTAIHADVAATQIHQWLALYDAAIGHLDDQVARLFQTLRDRRLLEDTLVIIVSDHGESYGEHGLFGHMFLLYETLLRVPLVVRFPRRAWGGRTCSAPVEILDVHPTILRAAGAPAACTHRGRDLTLALERPTPGRMAFAESSAIEPAFLDALVRRNPRYDAAWLTQDRRCVRTARYKYIRNAAGTDELYDLQADPREQDNLVLVAGDTRQVFETALATLVDSLRSAVAADGANIDARLQDRLADLGYFV